MTYKRISCSLYDKLESYSVLNKRIAITYKETENNITVYGVIKNIFAKNGAEFLLINTTEIRLDKIISIIE